MTLRDKLIEIARLELGKKEGGPYLAFLGLPDGLPWCAAFVSWCAHRAGVPETVVPRHASCTLGLNWFRERDRLRASSYLPAPGDLVYFDWDQSGDADHVGLVTSVGDGGVQTIEGNRGGAVGQGSYRIGSRDLRGFAVPDYDPRDNFPQGWAEQAVGWAVQEKILRGGEGGELGLTRPCTREEALVFLHRARKGEA